MAVVLTTGANLGETVLQGQIVVLDVDGLEFSGPTKQRPWFKVDIRAALGPEGAPDMKDVRWMMKGTRIYVVMTLPEGTIAVPDEDKASSG